MKLGTACIVTLVLCALAAPARAANVAASFNGGVASQSGTDFGGDASRANDGNRNGNYGNASVSHTGDGFGNATFGPSWQVALGGGINSLDTVQVFNRTDCCADRITPFQVDVLRQGNVVKSFTNQTFTADITGVDVSGMTFQLGGVMGDTVKVSLPGRTQFLHLAEVEANNLENLALASNGGVASASSFSSFGFGGIAGQPAAAIDGNTNGNFGNLSVSHTAPGDNNQFLAVNLAGPIDIVNTVVLYNRIDCCSNRLTDFTVELLRNGVRVAGFDHQTFSNDIVHAGVDAGMIFDFGGALGDTVRVSMPAGSDFLHLAEVQAFGTVLPEPTSAGLLALGGLALLRRRR